MELRCRVALGDAADQSDDRWVSVHCSRYEDPGGAGRCLIYQLHDITSRRVAESRLQHIAFHDSLTDLANRSCFHERLEGAVEQSRVDPSRRFAVMFLDLDRFKIVNDSLGHIAGNQLLREVARRLRECVRPTDLVARLGGDEFAVLLEGLHQQEIGNRLAERVLHALTQPLSINGTEVFPGASIGITFSDLGYRTVDEVLRDADLAMYEAKAAGRGRVVLFDSSMHERVAEKLALEADLRRAIGEGQLSVNFQPLYELNPYRLAGFEALARWVHPQRGPISPVVFIGLAEESGHIEALTAWVLNHSVAQLKQWHRDHPHMSHLGMHVNISGRDLGRNDLVDEVGQVLCRHDLAAEYLTLEITETTLMGRLDLALDNLGQLRGIGVRFSIDDFGTGYSSLAYLSTLPIDSMKIDRSFVMGLHDKPQNVEIVRAVANLGMSLGRKVIAEGIETAEQLATLRQLGVPMGQGYLLSRPLRADQVSALLLAETLVPVSVPLGALR
jgi:diguanylate cyclase (GGDEF)-like protein